MHRQFSRAIKLQDAHDATSEAAALRRSGGVGRTSTSSSSGSSSGGGGGGNGGHRNDDNDDEEAQEGGEEERVSRGSDVSDSDSDESLDEAAFYSYTPLMFKIDRAMQDDIDYKPPETKW